MNFSCLDIIAYSTVYSYTILYSVARLKIFRTNLIVILFIDFSDCLDLKFRCEVKIILSFAAFLLDISYFRLNPLSFAFLAFLMDFSFLDLFLTLGIGFPLYPIRFFYIITVILQCIRILVGNAGFKPGASPLMAYALPVFKLSFRFEGSEIS